MNKKSETPRQFDFFLNDDVVISCSHEIGTIIGLSADDTKCLVRGDHLGNPDAETWYPSEALTLCEA